MLAGAIRLTADVGVLLAYLETLAPAALARRGGAGVRRGRAPHRLREPVGDAPRAPAAGADRDLPGPRARAGALQPARRRRLPARVRRRASRRCRPRSPRSSRRSAPCIAGCSASRDRRRRDAAGDRLAAGLEQVLAAPDPVLRGYAEPLRVRMLELALDPGIPPRSPIAPPACCSRASPRTGKTFTRLAMRRASQLLARHVDDRARAVARRGAARAQPGFHAAERWLARARRAPHRPDRAQRRPARARPARGGLLARRPAAGLAPHRAGDRRPNGSRREAALQARARAPRRRARRRARRRERHPLRRRRSPPGSRGARRRAAPPTSATALALAAPAARVLRALALAGVALPDAEPERFCITSERAPDARRSPTSTAPAPRPDDEAAADQCHERRCADAPAASTTLVLPADADARPRRAGRTLDAAVLASTIDVQ